MTIGIARIAAAATLDDGSPVLVLDVDDLLLSIEARLDGGGLRTRRPAQVARRAKRILVVDDSITVREVERQLLEQRGYEVDIAVDGLEAWNALRAGRYDLLVSDVDMPRMTGIELVRAKVGDRYVLEELGRRGWLMGGEGSGHLLALDRHSTGDGIVSALQVLQAVQRSARSLRELLSDVRLYPQTLINVRLAPEQDWRANAHLAAETEAVQSALGERGRLLIRPSGTEPLLRIMIEGADDARIHGWAETIAAAVRTALA